MTRAAYMREWLQRNRDRLAALRAQPLDDRVAARFWPKVAKGPGCWEWQGSRDPNGYGKINIYQRPLTAHRVVWELTNGPIPAGLFVLHRCDNPPCVRPDHLFIGTNGDNMRDMVAKGRANRPPRKSHCLRGHAYAGDNILVDKRGRWSCRMCKDDWKREHRAEMSAYHRAYYRAHRAKRLAYERDRRAQRKAAAA